MLRKLPDVRGLGFDAAWSDWRKRMALLGCADVLVVKGIPLFLY